MEVFWFVCMIQVGTTLSEEVLDKLILKGKMNHYQKNPPHNTFVYSLDIGNHHSELFRAVSFLINS